MISKTMQYCNFTNNLVTNVKFTFPMSLFKSDKPTAETVFYIQSPTSTFRRKIVGIKDG